MNTSTNKINPNVVCAILADIILLPFLMIMATKGLDTLMNDPLRLALTGVCFMVMIFCSLYLGSKVLNS